MFNASFCVCTFCFNEILRFSNFDVRSSAFKAVEILHGLNSVRILSFFGPYPVRIRKIRTRITPNKDTFYAV